jgi:hypothetical protein
MTKPSLSDARKRRGLVRISRGGVARGWLPIILSAAVLGVLLGGILRLAWPPVAHAATCYLSSPLYTTEAQDGWHRGMRSAQMTVEDYASSCIEVDSLGVIDGVTFMEIGVSHDGPGVTPCGGGSPIGTPYLFETYQDSAGNSYCRRPSGQPVTPWAKEGFGVEDRILGTWIFWHNGNDLGNPFGAIDFTKGIPVTNSERHSTADSAWGHFEQNYWMTDSGWTAWDSSTKCGPVGNDPTFNNQIWSPSNITVSTGSILCP